MANEIIKVLDDLAKRFGLAIDWTAENVWPYIEQLGQRFVTYTIAINTFHILIYLICIIPCILGIRYIKKDPDWGIEHYQYISDSKAVRYGSYFILGLIIFIFVAYVSMDIETIITTIFLPEKTIIQELINCSQELSI